jgi:hypothetical protein
MVSNKLLDELRQLPPTEKLQIVQFLVNDLAAKVDENLFLSGAQYEVWSPFDAPRAAETLMQMLG